MLFSMRENAMILQVMPSKSLFLKILSLDTDSFECKAVRSGRYDLIL